jgi:NDP-sugar pyrophosphorylase family protein
MHEFRDVEDVGILSFKDPVGTYTTWYLSVGEEEEGRSEWSMVHYADCLTEIDYDDFISKIDEKFDGIIAVTNTVKHDYSEVSFTVDGVVQDFVEKPNVMNYSWSGIGLFKTAALEEFRTDGSQDFAFDIFPKMIKQDKLKAYPYNGEWWDVGNLNSYRKICAKFNGEKN